MALSTVAVSVRRVPGVAKGAECRSDSEEATANDKRLYNPFVICYLGSYELWEMDYA